MKAFRQRLLVAVFLLTLFVCIDAKKTILETVVTDYQGYFGQ